MPYHRGVREEQPADGPGIRNVVVDAFGRAQEADLVDALRRDGDLAISLVIEGEGGILGHVGLSHLKSPPRALALAPLSVRRDAQREGVGSALVGAAIDVARGRGCEIVFLLGDPDYYARFGFSAEVARRFPCRYAGPFLMALELAETPASTGPVIYADAFAALD